jgi:hypothetical protein
MPTIDSYELRIYPQAGSPPASPTASIAASSIQWNQTAPTVPPVPQNPTYFYIPDPVQPGKHLRWPITTYVTPLAPGFYFGVARAIAGGLPSGDSTTAPFEKLGPPPVPGAPLFG